MKARIASFRRSHKKQHMGQIIIKIDGVHSIEKAKELIGKKVKWITPSGKDIKGKISSPHGNSGNVRAIMEKGVPGQAIGTEIQVE